MKIPLNIQQASLKNLDIILLTGLFLFIWNDNLCMEKKWRKATTAHFLFRLDIQFGIDYSASLFCGSVKMKWVFIFICFF